MKQTAAEILDKAAGHMRDRAATYDKPDGERSMAQTVDIFNLFHGTTLTEAQGWHFMQILKDVRLFTSSGYHADSAEDCVAYAGLKAEARAKEAPEKAEQSDDDGWIDHDGSGCPVPAGTLVKAQHRNGKFTKGRALNDAFLTREYWRVGSEDCSEPHRLDIVRYQIISSAEPEQKQDADGWIDWAGGVCPVPGGTPVEVKFRNGAMTCGPALAAPGLRGTNWGRVDVQGWSNEQAFDIIRYRVLS